MKSIPIAALGMGVLAYWGNLSDSSGGTATNVAVVTDTAKDRAKWRLASLSAAREILDELSRPESLSPEDRVILVERLNGAMRDNMKAHVSRSESQKLCAGIAVQMRRENIDRRFKAVIAHANEQSPMPVLAADVTAQLGPGWSNTLENAMESFAKTELVPLFKDSRARAVGLLRQELEQHLRFPSETELNNLLRELLVRHPDTLHLQAADDELLQQKILALANPDQKAYFEELKTDVKDQTRRISNEIRKQYERQLMCLESVAAKDVPAECRQASAIGVVIIAKLESGLAAERAKAGTQDGGAKGAPVYPLLVPVRSGVPGVAAKLEGERLGAFLGASPVLTIEAESLAKVIRGDPEKHHTLAVSEELFRALLSTPLREKAVAAYADGAKPTGEGVYFASLLTATPGMMTAFESRVTLELRTQLPVARQVVSEEQFLKTYAALEQPLVLSPDALSALQDSGGTAVTSLEEAGKLVGISVRNPAALLEETVNRVLGLVNQKVREGYGVLTAQLALVRKLEQDRLAALRKDVAARRPFKEIRAEWQTALEAAWLADTRAQTTPYKEVLDLTLASLNKTVRQLYDAIQENPNAAAVPTPATVRANEPDQAKIKELLQDPARPEDPSPEQKKEVQPPAKTSPKGSGSEGASDAVLSRTRVDRRNEPDGILLMTGTRAGGATARLMSQLGATNCTAMFDPEKPVDAAGAIFEAMKGPLKTLWDTTVTVWQKEHSGFGVLKRRTPPKLKLFVVIESDDVRHRMSLQLRQHVEEAFQEWYKASEKGTPEVELDWKVGLTIDPVPVP